ncbi:MAG: protein-disulfide reductase DsbD domain-containing protein, partial [Bacteroidota bacterium]
MFILLGFAPSLLAQQQMKKKPDWNITFTKTDLKPGDETEIVFTSEIEKDWYMYSSDFDENLGPIVTSFTYEKHPSYELVGKVKPIKPKRKFEEVWNGEVAYFTGKAEFRQKVKILSANPKIKGLIEFQECSNVTGVCV